MQYSIRVYRGVCIHVYKYCIFTACKAEAKDECGWGAGAGLGKHAVCGPNRRPDFTMCNSKFQKRVGADVENLLHRQATSSGTQ